MAQSYRRSWFVSLALAAVVLAGSAACSKGGDGGSASDTTGSGSVKEYCAAMQQFHDTAQPYVNDTVPSDVGTQLANQLIEAVKIAPAGVKSDLASAIAGDSYAKDNVDLYNKRECKIDTTALKPASS